MHVPVYKWGGKTHIKTNFFQYHSVKDTYQTHIMSKLQVSHSKVQQ